MVQFSAEAGGVGQAQVPIFDALGRVYQVGAPVGFVHGVFKRHGSSDSSGGVSAGKQGDRP